MRRRTSPENTSSLVPLSNTRRLWCLIFLWVWKQFNLLKNKSLCCRTGCKRRIFDPGYLDSLHQSNVKLCNEGIQEFTENGIIGSSGIEDEFDIVVLATGFQVSQFLAPMEIYGRHGVSLNKQWSESRGAQAYYGTFVHNFPNLAIM